MKSIRTIYLTWRKGKGNRRHVVGVLKKNVSDGIRFEYIKKNIPDALKDGFTLYVDFPDLKTVYNDHVIDIFGQRLIKSERTDIQKYYDFWELDLKHVNDKYYMLAYTQGMLSTDNFEFLADFFPKKDLCFVSEICGLTVNPIVADTIKIGDELEWVKECDNKFDKTAVRVFKDDIFLGYVKKIHNKVFYRSLKSPLRIVVKNIDQNRSINRVFIRISF